MIVRPFTWRPQPIALDHQGQPISHSTKVDSICFSMSRRSRIHWPLWVFWLALGAAVGIYVVAVPCLRMLWHGSPGPSTNGWSEPQLGEQMAAHGAALFMMAWFFALGASFGSFVNVVAWRVPHGVTLLGSSRCPHCRVQIAKRDNVPILGWIKLRGRCRRCHLPISSRYLWVELALGLIYMVLGLQLFFRAGANVPGGPFFPVSPGLGWINFRLEPELVRLFLDHAFLFSVLLTLALMCWDRLQPPRSFALPCLLTVVFLPWIWTDLHPVKWDDWQSVGTLPMASPWWNRFLTGGVGLVAGTLWGALLGANWNQPNAWPDTRPLVQESSYALGLCGAALGWQAMLAIATLAATGRLAAVAIERRQLAARRPTPAGFFLASAFVLVCGWKWFDQIAAPIPSWTACSLLITATLFCTAASSWVLMRHRKPTPCPDGSVSK